MKKPIIFFGASIPCEKIAVSSDHVSDFPFGDVDFNDLRPHDESPCFTRPCDVNLSFDIDVEKTQDDVSLSNLFGGRPVFDVKMQDMRGNEHAILDAKISECLRVTHRIPRKLKKSLKKRHGVYWLQYHPNTESVVTIHSPN